MKEIIKDVAEFHKAFGIPIVDKPELPSEERQKLRRMLIAEEYLELLSALNESDLIKIADAAADLIYVLVGMCLEFGIPLQDVWSAVQEANMKKVGGPKRQDGKQMKPEGWEPPNIAKIILMAQR